VAQCPVRSKLPHMDKAPMGPEDAGTEQEGRKRGTRRNKSPATRSGWRGRRALLCEPLDVDHLRASCHTRPASATAAVNAITQRLARGTDRVPQPHWPCIASAASRHHHHTYTLKASCTVRASVAHKSSGAVQAEPPLLKSGQQPCTCARPHGRVRVQCACYSARTLFARECFSDSREGYPRAPRTGALCSTVAVCAAVLGGAAPRSRVGEQVDLEVVLLRLIRATQR